MKTKRGEKLHTTKKSLGQNRTRPDSLFQIKQIIGCGVQDPNDHVPSARHSWRLSSSMSGLISHICASLVYLINSSRPQRPPRVQNKSSTQKSCSFHPICGSYQLLLCLASLLPTVLADQNVTVDDQDPSILYSPPGAWGLSANSSLDFGGAHMLTQNPNATAVFKFTGSC